MNRLRLFLLLMWSLPSLLLADTAEIKMLIAEEMRPAAMKALDVKADGKPEVSICFFDTADMELDGRKLILRLRMELKAGKSGKRDLDAVVKLRGAAAPPEGFADLKPEADWVGPETVKPSYSIKVDTLDENLVAAVFEGKEPVKKVFSEEQQRFTSVSLGKDVPWTDLRRYGVIQAWKSKRDIGVFKDASVEIWKLTTAEGKPLELLEVSIKVKDAPAEDIATKAAAFYTAAETAGLGKAAGVSKTSQVIQALKPGK